MPYHNNHHPHNNNATWLTKSPQYIIISSQCSWASVRPSSIPFFVHREPKQPLTRLQYQPLQYCNIHPPILISAPSSWQIELLLRGGPFHSFSSLGIVILHQRAIKIALLVIGLLTHFSGCPSTVCVGVCWGILNVPPIVYLKSYADCSRPFIAPIYQSHITI